jgi:hypothetical protein
MKCVIKNVNSDNAVTFCLVTFHASVNSGAPNGLPHPNSNLKNSTYIRQIELLFRSVNVFHPHSKISLLTSASTDLTALKVHYSRLDCEIDPKALMMSRSLAQQNMVHKNDFSLPIILIDSDILLNGNLDYVFQQDFDVALTWRKSLKMPINGGVLILNNRRPNVVRKFFDDFVTIYRDNYIDSAGWYGDQFALRDLCGVTYREMRDRKIIEVGGCKVLFLPGDHYNFSPEGRYAAVMSRFPDIVILHFKGNRKRFMNAYWLAHLQLLERSSMLRWVSSYAMRKLIAFKAAFELPLANKIKDK